MFATRIEATVIKKLKHMSVDTDMPISDLVEKAIRDLLKKHEKKNKK